MNELLLGRTSVLYAYPCVTTDENLLVRSSMQSTRWVRTYSSSFAQSAESRCLLYSKRKVRTRASLPPTCKMPTGLICLSRWRYPVRYPATTRSSHTPRVCSISRDQGVRTVVSNDGIKCRAQCRLRWGGDTLREWLGTRSVHPGHQQQQDR